MNIYTHPQFYKHDTGTGHPEPAGRIDAALAGVDGAGLGERVIYDPPAHAETSRIIARTHDQVYAQELEEACRSGMRLFHSIDNPISSQSYAAAHAALATSLTAAEAMMRDRERAFLIARPPRHHPRPV